MFAVLLITQTAAVEDEDDVLAEVRALSAAVSMILASATATAGGEKASLAAQVSAILDSMSGTADPLPNYEQVLAAFEDGTHPMLVEETTDPPASEVVADEQLEVALRRELLRREHAELALEAAKRRVKKAEQRLQRVGGGVHRAKRKSKRGLV